MMQFAQLRREISGTEFSESQNRLKFLRQDLKRLNTPRSGGIILYDRRNSGTVLHRNSFVVLDERDPRFIWIIPVSDSTNAYVYIGFYIDWLYEFDMEKEIISPGTPVKKDKNNDPF